MKFAAFYYRQSTNLGDEIQSIAADRFLPKVDLRVNRDSMAVTELGEPHLAIMNGWYSHFPKTCFPPTKNFVPVIYSMHISDWNNSWDHFKTPACVDYLKSHGPVGCRDPRTRDVLLEMGVDAFHSSCVTLTLPKRTSEPKSPRTFFVDLPEARIDGRKLPDKIKKNAIAVSHLTQDIFGPDLKFKMANKLLQTYRNHGGLIVTSRLHCALPCIAMGIPVIVFGKSDDYRLSPLAELGVPIYSHPGDVDWEAEPVAIDDFREQSSALLKSMIGDRLAEFGDE